MVVRLKAILRIRHQSIIQTLALVAVKSTRVIVLFAFFAKADDDVADEDVELEQSCHLTTGFNSRTFRTHHKEGH